MKIGCVQKCFRTREDSFAVHLRVDPLSDIMMWDFFLIVHCLSSVIHNFNHSSGSDVRSGLVSDKEDHTPCG